MEESNHLFIMIPQQNLPSRMNFPGEFSGYYTFNPWRHRRIYNNNYDTIGYYNSPESKDSNYVTDPDLDKYSEIWLKIRCKMKDKDFVPVLDRNGCLVIRRDLYEFIHKEGTMSPDITINGIEFTLKGKLLIPPIPYLRISSNWYPPDIPGETIPWAITPTAPEVVNGEVLPYSIYYISSYFKNNDKYDFFPLVRNTFACTEKLVNRMLEFDSTLQFDPVYYPPVEE